MIGLILVAAGSGTRFGSEIPKQFTLLRGKPLYQHAWEPFASRVDEGVVVVPQGWQVRVREELGRLPRAAGLAVEVGGPERQDSVQLGLLRLSPAVRTVLVHDAVRPFVSAGLVQRVLEATLRHGACIPALPVAETVKRVARDRVVETLDRGQLYLVQTPQGFEVGLLRRAFEQARRDDFRGTDEASLVERLGAPVHVVEGEPGNVKVTWRNDLKTTRMKGEG